MGFVYFGPNLFMKFREFIEEDSVETLQGNPLDLKKLLMIGVNVCLKINQPLSIVKCLIAKY
jgi:hypothetical protein